MPSMPSIPENLVEALVGIININRRVALSRDSLGLQRARDILISAGCIEEISPSDCAVIASGCGHPVATGCIGCGRHGVHNDEGLCNDCRGPDDNDDCLGCVLKGSDCSDHCELADTLGNADTVGDAKDADNDGWFAYRHCIKCAKMAPCNEYYLCPTCNEETDCDEKTI